MNKVIERLVVSNGVIMAFGWCDGNAPDIVVNGQAAKYQVQHRYKRPDVSQHLGRSEDIPFGYITSALSPALGIKHEDVSLAFPDDNVPVRCPPISDDRVHEIFERFVREVSSAPDGASILELGSRARSGNTYRTWFPSASKHTGVDVSDGENVDLVADIHTLSTSVEDQFDFAFSISVFEHLLMPWVAAVELNKVLVEGGIAFIQSHPTWPLHDEPWDFFRFSKDSWHGLFNSLTGFEVLDAAHSMEACIFPAAAAGAEHEDMILQRTFLLSACLVKKISEPKVDWSCDPSGIYNLQYGY